MVKVICAGPPKTGTKSLARALRLMGYYEVWDYEDALQYGFDEWEGILQNKETNVERVIEKLYARHAEAVVDLPHSHFFEQFLTRWPEAKVILMTKQEDEWLNSLNCMLVQAPIEHPFISLLPYISPTSRRLIRWHESLFSTVMGSDIPNRLKWKMWFRRHNTYVKSIVPARQLLIYNVNEGWEPLCSFLGRPIPNHVFPFENQPDSRRAADERIIEDTPIVKRIKLETIVILVIAPWLLALFLYSSYSYMTSLGIL